MAGCDLEPLIVSGIGVTTAIGQGRQAFIDALLAGEHSFSAMRRPGRQSPQAAGDDVMPFIGAEIAELRVPGEAWNDAGLDQVDPERIGLIIGGSNFQQRELLQTQDRYRDRPQFLRPTYAMSFMDTDVCGLCSEVFGIRGLAALPL